MGGCLLASGFFVGLGLRCFLLRAFVSGLDWMGWDGMGWILRGITRWGVRKVEQPERGEDWGNGRERA